MRGRRSLHPELLAYVSEIERHLHLLQRNFMADNQSHLNPMAENPGQLNPIFDNQKRQMKDYFIPTSYNPSSCIQISNVPVIQYKIKSTTIQMLPSFYGNPNDEPYRHLDEFLEICSTIKIQSFTDDALGLTLFPFLLKDKAKYWLGTIGRPITTWADMQREFLKKFTPSIEQTQ